MRSSTLRRCLVGRHVVVVEEDLARLLLLDLGDDALGAAEAVLPAEHGRHRAEVAVEGAAPAGHDGRRAQGVLVAVDERQVGEGQRVEVGATVAGVVVDGLAVAHEGEAEDAVQGALAAQRLDELEHELLAALAAGHVVRVLQRLVGHEGDVGAADDDGDAVGADVVGELVARGRRRGGGRDADEVGRVHVVPVDGSDLRDVDGHVVAVLAEAAPMAGRPRRGSMHLAEDVHAGGFGLERRIFMALLTARPSTVHSHGKRGGRIC